MHYFPSWTPEIIANMSWDYYNMALASIPSPPDTEEDERKGMEVVDLRDMK